MMFKDAGPFAYLYILTGLLGFGLVVLSGILWAVNKRFSPGLTLLLLGFGAGVTTTAHAMAVTMSFNAVAKASAETKQTLLANGISVSLYNHYLLWLFLLPALLALVLAGGLAGIARGPRRRVEPGVAGALALVTAFAGSLACYWSVAGPMAWSNPVVYLVVGVVVALGLAGGNHETSGPTAGAAAALAFPVIVALTETATIAAGETEVFMAVARATAETKGEMLLRGIELVNAGRPAAWLAIAAATGVAIVGVVGALDEERPVHNAGLFIGLVATIAASLVLHSDASVVMRVMAWMFSG